VSGVVYLPPRRKRHLPSAIVRLGSLLHRAPSRRAADIVPAGADPGPLRVRCRRSRREHVVAVSGRLDRRTSAPLVDALEDALEGGAPRIVLDLAALESTDHAGLDVVLTAQLRAGDDLKLLFIVPGPEPVQRLFDDARGPFLYAARKDSRAAGVPRSRGGRTVRSAQPGRPKGRSDRIRRSG
jgi:anti-anti-sigma factor